MSNRSVRNLSYHLFYANKVDLQMWLVKNRGNKCVSQTGGQCSVCVCVWTMGLYGGCLFMCVWFMWTYVDRVHVCVICVCSVHAGWGYAWLWMWCGWGMYMHVVFMSEYVWCDLFVVRVCLWSMWISANMDDVYCVCIYVCVSVWVWRVGYTCAVCSCICMQCGCLCMSVCVFDIEKKT